MHYSYTVPVHCKNKINYRVLQKYHIESKKKYIVLCQGFCCVTSHRLAADFLWKIVGLELTPTKHSNILHTMSEVPKFPGTSRFLSI